MEGRYRLQPSSHWPASNAPLHLRSIGRRGGTQLHLSLINLFDSIYLLKQLIYVKWHSPAVLFLFTVVGPLSKGPKAFRETFLSLFSFSLVANLWSTISKCCNHQIVPIPPMHNVYIGQAEKLTS